MDPRFNKSDDASPLAQEALAALAAELPLEVLLLELRRFYRAAWDGPVTRSSVDCRQVCDTSLAALDTALRALDSALWRLETDDA